jgi:flagellum-specific ATP synthase
MNLTEPRIERLRIAAQDAPKFRLFGQVEKVIGLVIESNGPVASIGHLCYVSTLDGEGNSREVPVEVVGFRGSQTLLMPLGDLSGIKAGDSVHGTGEFLKVPVGNALLGRILDGLGQPLDDKPAPLCELHYPTMASPPNALQRNRWSHDSLRRTTSRNFCWIWSW